MATVVSVRSFQCCLPGVHRLVLDQYNGVRAQRGCVFLLHVHSHFPVCWPSLQAGPWWLVTQLAKECEEPGAE